MLASLPAAPPQASRGAKKIQRQVQKVGLVDASGQPDRAIFEESALVINLEGKLLELRAEYAIYNQNGLQLAAVRGKRMSSRMQVVDMNGRQLLDLRREGLIIISKVTASSAKEKVGRIFSPWRWNELDRDSKLEGADNTPIGAVYAEDRRELTHRQRNREFNVQDASGTVVANVSKTGAGVTKELLTKADNYVLDIPRP